MNNDTKADTPAFEPERPFLGKWRSLEDALRDLNITMEEFGAVHKKLEDEKISKALGGRSDLEFVNDTWNHLPEKTKREIVLILIRAMTV